MQSNLVKISSQKTFETSKISLSWFNFLKWYELPYIKYVESPVLVACQWSRMLTWFPIISISLFFLGAVFYMQWLRSGTDLITCESELHGWVSRMACSILSLIGTGIGVAAPSSGMDYQPIIRPLASQHTAHEHATCGTSWTVRNKSAASRWCKVAPILHKYCDDRIGPAILIRVNWYCLGTNLITVPSR